MSPQEVQVIPRPLHFTPFVGSIVDHLGITKAVDELLPTDPRAKVTHGQVVKLLIMSAMDGRVALYQLHEWLERSDCEVLFGKEVKPDHFHDNRISQTLDKLFKVGTDNVLSRVVQSYLLSDACPKDYTVHADTTSVSLQGAFEPSAGVPGEGGGPLPTYGFSKDHRPDLKQLVFGLTLHGAVGMPLTYRALDGNTDDHTFNKLNLQDLARLLPKEHEVTLVADAKFVDPKTLGRARAQGFRAISLLARSYGLRAQLVEEACSRKADQRELFRGPGRNKAARDRVYRGLSFQRPFMVWDEETQTKQAVPYRFLVVHSSQLEAKFDASLEDKMRKEVERADAKVRSLARKGFRCVEDAEAEAAAFQHNLTYYRAEVSIEAEVVRGKRSRPGRPRKDDPPPPSHTVYRLYLENLHPDPERIDRARRHASHFVLITDHLDTEAWPDERILDEYRHQRLIEGHTGFRWLKGVARVAPVFLKRPSRIAALGLVLMLALMVRNYIQFTVRRRLKQEDWSIRGLKKKPVQNPTTETILQRFASVFSTLLVVEDRAWRHVSGIDESCRTILACFDLDETIFTKPLPRPQKLASAPP